MNHPRHRHALFLLETPIRPYKCKDCNELGFGRCYHCPFAGCNFHVHAECATAEPFAAHPFEPTCPWLEYRPNSSFKRACDACGRTISGARYRHRLDVFRSVDFHPCCLTLRRSIAAQGVELRLFDGVSSKCLKCNHRRTSFWGGTRGWSYTSPCGQLCYHVACVKDSIVESFENGGFDRGAYDGAGAVPGASFSSGQGNQIARRSTAGRFVKMVMVRMVFKLVISAIFGDPTTIISDVIIGALSSSHG